MCAIAVACASLAGCGQAPGGTARYRERVRDLVPAASSIECSRQAHGAHCTVLAGPPPGGSRLWTCEFTYYQAADPVAYSGTESCWREVIG